MQKYTSKNTSINSKKIPALFGKFSFEGKSVLDYGCGKYPEIIREYVEGCSGKYFGYDPYNLGNEIPKGQTFDVVTISNVLNVIQEDEVIESIIREAMKLASTAIVSIYEGDKSGIGRMTKKDCYQRNQNRDWYCQVIDNMGYKTEIKSGCILITK